MKISTVQIRRTLPARFVLHPLVFAAVLLGSQLAQGQHASPVKLEQQTVKKTATPAVVQDPGERKFQANCSRCHTAPEQLSPRITGTIVRHMRVRASLSAEDARDILRYLAP
jgi:mono/diheme cytochrome c family protein